MSMSNLLGLAGYGSEGDHTDTDDETTHLPKPPLKTKSLVEDYGDDDDAATPRSTSASTSNSNSAASTDSSKAKLKPSPKPAIAAAASDKSTPSPQPKANFKDDASSASEKGRGAGGGKKRKPPLAATGGGSDSDAAKPKRKAKKAAVGTSPTGSTLMHLAGNYRTLEEVFASREYKSRNVIDDKAESRTKQIQKVRLSAQRGEKYNQKVRSVRAYKNPTILQQIVENYDLDQYGTHYPRDLYDPSIPKEDTVKEIRDQRIKYKAKRKSELQEEEEKKKSLEPGNLAKRFTEGSKNAANANKRSKWDNPAGAGGASAASTATAGVANPHSHSVPRSRSVGGAALPSAASIAAGVGVGGGVSAASTASQISLAQQQARLAAQLHSHVAAANLAAAAGHRPSMGVGVGVGVAQRNQAAASLARIQALHSQSSQILSSLQTGGGAAAAAGSTGAGLPPSALYDSNTLTVEQRASLLKSLSSRR